MLLVHPVIEPQIEPIPKHAMPVVEILRRDVPRPQTLPVMTGRPYCSARLRWGNRCAMGLHPNAKTECPMGYNFGQGNEPGIYYATLAFATWFDQQTDAQGVVDAIWPEGGA